MKAKKRKSSKANTANTTPSKRSKVDSKAPNDGGCSLEQHVALFGLLNNAIFKVQAKEAKQYYQAMFKAASDEQKAKHIPMLERKLEDGPRGKKKILIQQLIKEASKLMNEHAKKHKNTI